MQKRSSKYKEIKLQFLEETFSKRIKTLQYRLAKAGVDAVLLRQNADLFYFTGTVQDGHLVIPAEGEPFFYVWRSYKRALKESPLASLGLVRPLQGLGHFRQIIYDSRLKDAKVVGLEMDVLPAKFYIFYRDAVWPKARLIDISPEIRALRSIKDRVEIQRIRQAALQVHSVFGKVPEFLKNSQTELDLAANIEAELRRQGHCGLMRMRIWNQEIGMGQIVSGASGTVPSWTNTPVGGLGPHPSFGMGASFKEIVNNEMVSVDLGGWHKGYCCDVTRPFFIGNAPKEVRDAFVAIKTLLAELEKRLVPGAVAGELYDYAGNFMKGIGKSKYFMGIGRDRVSFVGHGLGIELDEFPFIAKDSKMVLQAGMVVALEPKLILSPYGVVGLEDTYLIKDEGCERLTLGEQELVMV